MQAIILDTETHTLNGQPIEIAYAPIQVNEGKLTLDKTQIFDQFYSVDEPISYAATSCSAPCHPLVCRAPHYLYS